MSRFLGGACLALAQVLACNECDYGASCDADVRLVCRAGVDQVVGRTIVEEPCEAPNGTCVEAEEHNAVCVTGQPCEPATTPAACDGDRLTLCLEGVGYLQVTDCAAELGTSCVVEASGATCAQP